MTGNPQCEVNVECLDVLNAEQKEANEQKEKNEVLVEDYDESFVEVKRKKNIGIDNKVKRQNFRANPQVNKDGNSKTVYQAKTKEVKSPKKNLTKMPKAAWGNEKEKTGNQGNSKKNELKDMEIVDNFLNKQIKPTDDDMKGWSIDMISYYKKKNEELVDKGKKDNTKVHNNKEFEDILEEISGVAKCMGENEVKGLSTSDKQDEIAKLIQEEKLQICAILETHLKSCRIMVGWNDDMINIGVVHMARQSMLVRVETRDENLRLYGTFIYASNSSLERKDLWEDLKRYKRIVGQDPWFLSGDLNVTLTPKEHSIGSSAMTSDMKDFQRCVNSIEVEDINTWTKNLHKTKTRCHTEVLKKLDKVMGNEDFSNSFEGNDVAEQFIKHFQQFLGESRHVEPISDMATLFKNKLSRIEADYMVREVSDDEIKDAMFQIDDNKAPDLDRDSAAFFKKD
ncbi:RNA-directed DNA polymerase, eukaryota, reverse transcriptase zinc-binding domain protein [Tanacetum coccineum]